MPRSHAIMDAVPGQNATRALQSTQCEDMTWSLLTVVRDIRYADDAKGESRHVDSESNQSDL